MHKITDKNNCKYISNHNKYKQIKAIYSKREKIEF